MSHQSELISQDILAYLKQHENKDLLRFLTCGNVDDGKSTLIGRLLYDSKLIYEDQLQAVTRDSKKVGTTGDAPDLALLVDGLQAEREQGITIDVAWLTVTQLADEVGIFRLNLIETRFREFNQVHFVNRNNNVLNTQYACNIRVTACLRL